MKKRIIILSSALFLFSFFAKGQENKTTDKEKTRVFLDTDRDTTKLLNGKLRIISSGKDKGKSPGSIELTTKKDSVRTILETHWGGFDIGFNNYTDKSPYHATYPVPNADPTSLPNFCRWTSPDGKDFELRPGKSVHINFTIVKQQLSFYKNYISLVYGLTYDINNWNYKNSITWHKQPEFQTTIAPIGPYMTKDSVSFKTNKLVTNYLQTPILLRIETCPRHMNKNVCISAGGYAGYLVRSHTKQIESGTTTKVKQFEPFNLNKFQYGMQFELGYQGISLYFKKSLSPLTDFGTVQSPYSFGVRILGL